MNLQDNFMSDLNIDPAAAQLASRISSRAEQLFAREGMLCSTAVLTAINEILDGQVPRELAVRLTTGMGEGMGGSGCACGALSGGVMALGLFLGSEKHRLRANKDLFAATRQLHDRFRSSFGATCCRVLTKGLRSKPRELFRQCTRNTTMAALWAAEIILSERPDLMNDRSTAALPSKRSFWQKIKRMAGI